MAKNRTIYYSGVLITLGAVALAVVSLTYQHTTVDTRSNASNLGNAYPAQGAVDLAPNSLCQVRGWAVDLDAPQLNQKIKVYLDKPYNADPDQNGIFLGDYTANSARPDVNTALKIGGNHGFQADLFSNDKMPKDSQPHSLYVYTLDASGGTEYILLTNTPKTLTCVPAKH